MALAGGPAAKRCAKCSGVKRGQLGDAGIDGNMPSGRMGKCIKERPELEGKASAKIDGGSWCAARPSPHMPQRTIGV